MDHLRPAEAAVGAQQVGPRPHAVGQCGRVAQAGHAGGELGAEAEHVALQLGPLRRVERGEGPEQVVDGDADPGERADEWAHIDGDPCRHGGKGSEPPVAREHAGDDARS